MLSRLLECALGIVLAGMTLRDVFDTVVVPGRTHGVLKISRRLVFVALPLWKRVRQGGVGVNFAPAVLVASFGLWMLLLVLSFALMAHGVRDSFSPAMTSFGDALYAAGSALTTIGNGRGEATGAARLVVVAAGFCGLGVMTLAVTYLLEVQGNIAQRDTGVLKMSTTAGHPPSAIVLLERYGNWGCPDELVGILRQGRDWCAGVLQSHVSHPSLIYFRSAGTASGWPATLGTLMDLALIVEHLVEVPGARGPALLARDEAHRLARELVTMLGLQPVASAVTAADVAVLCARLQAAGYPLKPDPDIAAFLAARVHQVGCIDALSQHLGSSPAPLLPQ